jgi:dTMP kinase
MTKGKLIVIEGADGTGKGTQFDLLIQYCKTKGIAYFTCDFPQYYKTFFGKFAGKFLKGEFGNIDQIPPYIISIPFAADRWQAKDDIEHALSQGKLVILNRYTTSNAAYQGAKLPAKELQNYIDWLYEMEYNQFKIPKEDLVIYLDVESAISQTLIEQKSKRKYLGNGKKDIHEADMSFQDKVKHVYQYLAKTYPHWVSINCSQKGELLSKQVIHEKIIALLKKKKYL